MRWEVTYERGNTWREHVKRTAGLCTCFHRDSSARNHAFAIVHSRTTVAAEIPMTCATSSIVNPPK
jgi:hypothetical protein